MKSNDLNVFLRFGAAVYVRDEFITQAFGSSKKEAKRNAAEQALYKLLAHDEVLNGEKRELKVCLGCAFSMWLTFFWGGARG